MKVLAFAIFGRAGSNPAFGTNHTFPAPIKAFPRFQTIFLNTC
jgi:hypothetical protein